MRRRRRDERVDLFDRCHGEKPTAGSFRTCGATLVQAFGVNVPRLLTLTYGLGAALAGLAGVLAAPIYQVSPLMGTNLIIIVFAVVVVGGMGSILGAIVTGYMLGVLEGLTKVFYPEASSIVIFVVMAVVLLVDRQACSAGRNDIMVTETSLLPSRSKVPNSAIAFAIVAVAALVAAPFFLYPIFLMSVLLRAVCMRVQPADRLRGPARLRPRAFFDAATWCTAHAVKVWGWEPLSGILLLGAASAAVLGGHRRLLRHPPAGHLFRR